MQYFAFKKPMSTYLVLIHALFCIFKTVLRKVILDSGMQHYSSLMATCLSYSNPVIGDLARIFPCRLRLFNSVSIS